MLGTYLTYRSSRYEFAPDELPPAQVLCVCTLAVVCRGFLTAACLAPVGVAVALGCAGTGCSATLACSIGVSGCAVGTGSVWTFGATCAGFIGVSCWALGT